jgi:hypothetical protein
MRFRAKGGDVALLSLFCDVEKFKIVIAPGECVGGASYRLRNTSSLERLFINLLSRNSQ